jgi:ABC-2 type transport system ATP-binding protein
MHTAETMCDYIFMIYKGVKVLDGRLADIQAEYGQDTLRVQVEGGLGVLRDLPGVDLVRDLGQVQELHMTKDCDPQVVLKVLLERTRVTGFEISKPSLHDIFIRIAGAEAQELNHAQSASRRVA